MLNLIVSLVEIQPALLKKRFNDELIELLLEFKWWDLPPEKLVTVLPLLCDFDLEKVTKKIKEIIEQ